MCKHRVINSAGKKLFYILLSNIEHNQTGHVHSLNLQCLVVIKMYNISREIDGLPAEFLLYLKLH